MVAPSPGTCTEFAFEFGTCPRNSTIRYVSPEYLINPILERYPLLKDRIDFKGAITSRKELFELYASSRVTCIPSRTENFSLTSLEAASWGAIVICSDFDAAFDLTDNGKFGYIFENGNIMHLTKILTENLANDEINAKMSAGIASYIAQNFDWTDISRKLHEALREIN